MPCCCESSPGLTSACSPPSRTLACASLHLAPCWSFSAFSCAPGMHGMIAGGLGDVGALGLPGR